MNQQAFMRRMAQMKNELKQFHSRVAPARAAEVAVRMFKENFQRQAFFGSRWKSRKNKYRYVNGEKRVNNSRILTQTGDLGRSIRAQLGDGEATVYSDVKYAEVHNRGLRSGRGRGFVMPKRPFIGSHKRLTDGMKKAIEKGLEAVMKKYK